MNASYNPASVVVIAAAVVLLLVLLRARSPLLTVALIGPLFFFIVAAILHASQLFVMGAMVLGIALLSYLLSTLSLHHVAVSREVPSPLTAGEAAPFTLTVENKGRLPKVFLRISAGIPPGIDAVPKHHLLAVLWPGQRASLEGVITAPTRGAYPLAPVEVVATDPLGLFHRRRALPGTGEILVYPRICRIEYHEYLGESAYGSTSPRHSVLPGHGLDFHSLRDYQPGDDLRRVDWKTSARMGRMVVIEFEPVTVGDVLVVLDSRASGPPLELAVTAAASWLGQVLDQGARGDSVLRAEKPWIRWMATGRRRSPSFWRRWRGWNRMPNSRPPIWPKASCRGGPRSSSRHPPIRRWWKPPSVCKAVARHWCS